MDIRREHWRTINHGLPDIHEDSYSVEGLSQLLRISRDVIRHEIATGYLHAERCGTHTICINRDAVCAWLERRGQDV